jgi:hypothetical protein
MAWMYVLEAESVAGPSSESGSAEPSAMSRTMPIARGYFEHECPMAVSVWLQSGTTSRPSTGDLGADAWISSLVASRASRGVWRVAVEEKQTPAIFGPTSSAYLARYDPQSHSWRTFQGSLLEEACAEFVGTWPKSGMMRNGILWVLGRSGHRTSATGCGLWRTPAAQEPGWKHIEIVDKDGNPPEHPNQRLYDKNTGRVVQQDLTQQVRMWRTPTAYDWKNTGYAQQTYLSDQVRPEQVGNPKKILWPTPSARDWKSGKSSEATRGRNARPLNEVVGYATPQARDYRTGQASRWTNPQRSRNLNDQVTAGFPTPTAARRSGLQSHGRNVVSGQLNPEFVSWLMGWPRYWTLPSEPHCAIMVSDEHKEAVANAQDEARPREVLQTLREPVAPEAIRGATRGLCDAEATDVLRPHLYGRAHDPGEPYLGSAQEAGRQVSRKGLRELWRDGEPEYTPHGQEPGKQRPSELEDLVRFLSHPMALGEWEATVEKRVGTLQCMRAACNSLGVLWEALPTLQEAWLFLPDEEKGWAILATRGGPWVTEWPGVPRIATGVKNRVDRLRMLGNGWVPQVAMLVGKRIAEALARLVTVQ